MGLKFAGQIKPAPVLQLIANPPPQEEEKARPATKMERLKLHWLAENMRDSTGYSLKKAAEHFGMSYSYVRTVSSEEKWSEELRETLHSKASEATETVRTLTLGDEILVRTRQAQYAKLIQAKAILKLQSIDPEKLSVREATELLRLGLEQERRALGMVEKVEKVQVDVTEKKTEVVKKALDLINSFPNSAAEDVPYRMNEEAEQND